MDNILTEILSKQNLIQDFCKKYGITYLGVFGSFARGEEKGSSDIDILVKFNHSGGLLEFIRIENELSSLLKRKVDLVTEKALHHLLRDKILKEVVPIYEEQREG
jgi:predicted nucleotidyltransferase